MLDLFVLSCILFLVESHEGEILPPQNLSLQWKTDFHPKLTWEPPKPVKNCTYKYNVSVDSNSYPVTGTLWSEHTVMKGGVLEISIQTLCNDRTSEWVSIRANYQNLVKNLTCHIHSPEHAHCSWVPAIHAPDLRFFYHLGENPTQDEVLECSSYSNTSGVRTGCSLKASVTNRVIMVFNATLNQTLTRNTFQIYLGENVRPDCLNWTVTESEEEFNISWIPPDFFDLSDWTFDINYTECNEARAPKSTRGKTWTTLPRVSHCQYQMNIRAEKGRDGLTPWSNIKSFEAVQGPSAWEHAVIIIPLVFAILAALSLMCCRKNKKKLFPKVPQPKDFLSDISDNNNKSPCDLFVPEEEENCKITLVMDPQIDKLDS